MCSAYLTGCEAKNAVIVGAGEGALSLLRHPAIRLQIVWPTEQEVTMLCSTVTGRIACSCLGGE